VREVAVKNLARLNEEAIERRGDYQSLFFEGRWHGSAELFERSRRLAGGLIELGIKPGERVVVCMANCPEVTVAYHALWRAGAVATPALFLLATEDLRHVIADSEASAVITTPEFVDKVRDAVAPLEHVRHVISAGQVAPDAHGGVLDLGALEESDPAPIVPRADDDLAVLLYTGGTTGRAKGVMISHASLNFTGQAVEKAAHVDGMNRHLMTLPLAHAYGILITISGLHAPERPVVMLMRWFDPGGFLALVQEHKVQSAPLVPSMIQMLLSQPVEEFDLRSLTVLGSGAAPLPPEVVEEVRRRLPWVSIREGYGLSETAALVSTNPAGREKPGSVGLPVPGTSVRILDDADQPLPAGEPGEVCVRSTAVMQGYWRAPEATAEAIRDGWLHTGDIGYLDDEGYLFIVDRKKDLIIRGGFNVYPRDIEDALLEHPAVAAAGVVGRPDERRGEEVVAFVSLSSPDAVSADGLVAWARERIGGYKYPREVHIVDTIPLTAVGKLDRKELRARVGGA
jgi:long-chain acyl-CoA synthetase